MHSILADCKINRQGVEECQDKVANERNPDKQVQDCFGCKECPCKNCKEGFYQLKQLSGGIVCRICTAGCLECTDILTCKKCKSGMYPGTFGLGCSYCGTSDCLECSSADNCTLCVSDEDEGQPPLEDGSCPKKKMKWYVITAIVVGSAIGVTLIPVVVILVWKKLSKGIADEPARNTNRDSSPRQPRNVVQEARELIQNARGQAPNAANPPVILRHQLMVPRPYVVNQGVPIAGPNQEGHRQPAVRFEMIQLRQNS